ncbi:alpha-N-arabinofuranosidase [Paenibacillus sp. FSL A5-0031]|uniref:family 43 glycosylhydrolase n=1 Tax=Paenibacillus sp. FSL A5-0031 TaxID=1920420 RepID=UPI00096D5D90|nr:family 43 glycosylhydrolase [Paenibacillus sp. FSL A5-0031]OME84995.1 alpha-N-arabinofuranosidase [Paenibacillus sp. FSL A5-0031]
MKLNRKRITLIASMIAVIIIILGAFIVNKMNHDTTAAGAYNGHGGTFKNTLASMDTPDPSIIYVNGFYYMTFTHNGTDIMIMKSRSLDFNQAERKVVWYPPVDTMYSANLWAPEIQYIQGKFYIYFAADNGENENHRMYALEAETSDPMGSYAFKGQVTDSTNKWAIDGLALEHEGQLYFVWSGWEGDLNVQQNTYIAPMSNPYTISGPRVLLSEPDLEWERAGGPPFINEGQAILKKDGRVWIAYSGAGSWTPFYSIGLLSLELGADPLDPAKWTKAEQPLMQMDGDAEVYGPGHNTFVASPDGTEDWIVYHATSGQGDGWNNRKARAQRIEWQKDGLPVFGSPLSLATAIEVPAGTGLIRAEHAAATDKDNLDFSGISSSLATDAPLLVHYTNDAETEQRIQVNVNDAVGAEIILLPTKPNEVGYVYASIALNDGQNHLSFIGNQAADLISAIEIPRFEAEYAQFSSDSELIESSTKSNGRSVQLAEGDKDAIRFDHVRVPMGGKYALHLSVANGTGSKQMLELKVNSGRVQKISIPASEADAEQQITVSVNLKMDDNTLQFGNATGPLEIDYIDIVSDRN